ncbi:hypothetical protein GCM10009612_35160 [Streptomyces beijiangensis]
MATVDPARARTPTVAAVSVRRARDSVVDRMVSPQQIVQDCLVTKGDLMHSVQEGVGRTAT